MLRSLLLVVAMSSMAASLASWMLFFVLYWPHRHRFDDAGRYLDPASGAVHHSQSGLLVVPALFFLLLASLLIRTWRTRRPRGG